MQFTPEHYYGCDTTHTLPRGARPVRTRAAPGTLLPGRRATRRRGPTAGSQGIFDFMS